MNSFNLQIELGGRVRTPDDVSRALFSLANRVNGESWDDLDDSRVLLDDHEVGEWRVEGGDQ
jgi:hypothetical protein